MSGKWSGRTFGSPAKWAATTPTPVSAATRRMAGSRRPVGSLRMLAPAAIAARATSGL